MIGAAVMIDNIATGEIDDLTTDDGKNPPSSRFGAWREGAAREEITRKAAASHWGGHPGWFIRVRLAVAR